MFIVLLNYVKPMEAIDELVPAHRAYLDEHFKSGLFVLSGRREPRTGGVILAQAGSREALAETLAQDPFAKGGVAEYEIIEFRASKAGKALTILLDGEE